MLILGQGRLSTHLGRSVSLQAVVQADGSRPILARGASTRREHNGYERIVAAVETDATYD